MLLLFHLCACVLPCKQSRRPPNQGSSPVSVLFLSRCEAGLGWVQFHWVLKAPPANNVYNNTKDNQVLKLITQGHTNKGDYFVIQCHIKRSWMDSEEELKIWHLSYCRVFVESWVRRSLGTFIHKCLHMTGDFNNPFPVGGDTEHPKKKKSDFQEVLMCRHD